MKKYRTYTAKKYKLARRIIFYAVVALIILGLTLILGNHLKNKLETADTKEPLDLDTTAPEKKVENDGAEQSVPHDAALSGVISGYISLGGITDENSAEEAVEAVRTNGFNGISFVVTDSKGNLTYRSPAVEKESRLPADTSLLSYDILERAVTRARNLGMTATAVISASQSISDELVAAELSEMGFNEIIIRGFEKYTVLTGEQVAEIDRYVSRIRNAVEEGTAVSISFAPEFYKSPKNAPYIEKKIFQKTEFLSIDMTGITADDASVLGTELAGSFTRYLLRPILAGDDKDSTFAINTALGESGIKARQYISTSAEISPDDTED